MAKAVGVTPAEVPARPGTEPGRERVPVEQDEPLAESHAGAVAPTTGCPYLDAIHAEAGVKIPRAKPATVTETFL